MELTKLSCTFQQYKDNYVKKLSKYLNEYEDNTEASFLENELTEYNSFFNSLNEQKENQNNIGFKTLGEYINTIYLERNGVNLKNHIISTRKILEFIENKVTSNNNVNNN